MESRYNEEPVGLANIFAITRFYFNEVLFHVFRISRANTLFFVKQISAHNPAVQGVFAPHKICSEPIKEER